jgi:hypothetical protein
MVDLAGSDLVGAPSYPFRNRPLTERSTGFALPGTPSAADSLPDSADLARPVSGNRETFRKRHPSAHEDGYLLFAQGTEEVGDEEGTGD